MLVGYYPENSFDRAGNELPSSFCDELLFPPTGQEMSGYFVVPRFRGISRFRLLLNTIF